MKFIPHDYQQYAIQFLTEHPVGCIITGYGVREDSHNIDSNQRVVV